MLRDIYVPRLLFNANTLGLINGSLSACLNSLWLRGSTFAPINVPRRIKISDSEHRYWMNVCMYVSTHTLCTFKCTNTCRYMHCVCLCMSLWVQFLHSISKHSFNINPISTFTFTFANTQMATKWTEHINNPPEGNPWAFSLAPLHPLVCDASFARKIHNHHLTGIMCSSMFCSNTVLWAAKHFVFFFVMWP